MCPSLWMWVVLALCFGCDWMPGKPNRAERPVLPSEVMGFDELYGQNCAGCHGAEGKLGASLPLNDPTYLSWIGKRELIAITSGGVSGTSMPAFLDSSGGTLTKQQIESLIDQMLARWGRADSTTEAQLPPYRSSTSAGDPEHGAIVYQRFCERCHGKGGQGESKGGSIADGAYLALVSDQALRTVTVVGRKDLGMPDWRGYVPGSPMTTQEIDDVVAWMASQRKRFPGQPYADRTKTN